MDPSVRGGGETKGVGGRREGGGRGGGRERGGTEGGKGIQIRTHLKRHSKRHICQERYVSNETHIC